ETNLFSPGSSGAGRQAIAFAIQGASRQGCEPDRVDSCAGDEVVLIARAEQSKATVVQVVRSVHCVAIGITHRISRWVSAKAVRINAGGPSLIGYEVMATSRYNRPVGDYCQRKDRSGGVAVNQGPAVGAIGRADGNWAIGIINKFNELIPRPGRTSHPKLTDDKAAIEGVVCGYRWI